MIEHYHVCIYEINARVFLKEIQKKNLMISQTKKLID